MVKGRLPQYDIAPERTGKRKDHPNIFRCGQVVISSLDHAMQLPGNGPCSHEWNALGVKSPFTA
jgi:hypothetical protein